MEKITLTNDFHGTTVNVQPDPLGWLSPRQVKRAEKLLCGMTDCLCAQSALGTRGRQSVKIEESYDGSGRTICRLIKI
jgi:hypothetical protein